MVKNQDDRKANNRTILDRSSWTSNSKEFWIVIISIALAILILIILPISIPAVAILLTIGGVILRRKSDDKLMKLLSLGLIIFGIILLFVSIFVISGLLGYGTFTSTTSTTTTP